MKHLSRRAMSGRSDVVTAVLVSGIAFFAKFPFDGAEDIVNARENLIHGSKSDFWGSFSPWFYSLFQHTHWELSYALLFTSLIGFSIFQFSRLMTIHSASALKKIGLLILGYASLSFALAFSRDGALLTFILFSLANLLLYSQVKSSLRFVWFSIFIISMIVGFAFRPWLSLSAPFILLAFYKMVKPDQRKMNIKKALVVLLLVAIGPLALDQVFHKQMKLIPSYPQQQVMIMDASSLACLSANPQDVDEALITLRPLATSPNLNKETLCSQYYPQNWASVVFYGSRDGAPSALKMISPKQEEIYGKFQRNWLDLIFSRLPTYLQTKIMLGSQFLLAGESPRPNMHNFSSLLQLPLEVAKFFRLFSAFPVLILLLLLLLRGRVSNYQSTPVLAISAFYLSFLAISTIAFIGDNQRYIFSGAIIVYLFSLLSQVKIEGS